MALKRLNSELKQIEKESYYFFSVCPIEDNLYKWDIIMIGPPDSIFEGAIIKAYIEFPHEYPYKPPQLIFNPPIFHPNVYTNGKVCISILHEGIDETNYESVSERWLPSRSVNSILHSILYMISSPNLDSPANVDACILCKNDYDAYKKKIYNMVAISQ